MCAYGVLIAHPSFLVYEMDLQFSYCKESRPICQYILYVIQCVCHVKKDIIVFTWSLNYFPKSGNIGDGTNVNNTACGQTCSGAGRGGFSLWRKCFWRWNNSWSTPQDPYVGKSGAVWLPSDQRGCSQEVVGGSVHVRHPVQKSLYI